MKKIIASILALGLLLAAAPVYAASETSGESLITLVYPENTPSYTITIPADITLTMDAAGVDIPIVASDVVDLDGGKISVTVAGTQTALNWFRLDSTEKNHANSWSYTYYDVTTANGEFLPFSIDGLAQYHEGKELVSFTDSGEKSFNIVHNGYGNEPYDYLTYEGRILYGISYIEV